MNPDQKPPSATLTPKSAPRRLERGLDAPVRLSFTKSTAEKHGLLDRYEAAIARRLNFICKKQDAANRLKQVLDQAKAHAAESKMSHRKLLEKAGLSWGTWKRCESGQADPVIWLPKVQAALDRVLKAKHD